MSEKVEAGLWRESRPRFGCRRHPCNCRIFVPARTRGCQHLNSDVSPPVAGSSPTNRNVLTNKNAGSVVPITSSGLDGSSASPGLRVGTANAGSRACLPSSGLLGGAQKSHRRRVRGQRTRLERAKGLSTRALTGLPLTRGFTETTTPEKGAGKGHTGRRKGQSYWLLIPYTDYLYTEV